MNDWTGMDMSFTLNSVLLLCDLSNDTQIRTFRNLHGEPGLLILEVPDTRVYHNLFNHGLSSIDSSAQQCPSCAEAQLS